MRKFDATSGDAFSRPITVPLAAAWCAAVYLALNLGIVLLSALSPSATQDIVSLGAVQLLVLGGGCTLLAAQHRPIALAPGENTAFARLFGLDRAAPSSLLLGAAVGILIKFPADAIRALTERLWPTPDIALAAQLQLLRHDTLGQMLALVIVIGVLGPLVEELLYRGVLYRLLEQSKGILVAALFTAIAFTLTHAGIRDWPALALVAGVLTLLRMQTGTLWAGLSAHVAFNCATLFSLFTGYERFLDPFEVGPGFVLVGGVLSAVLLVLVPRHGEDRGSGV